MSKFKVGDRLFCVDKNLDGDNNVRPTKFRWCTIKSPLYQTDQPHPQYDAVFDGHPEGTVMCVGDYELRRYDVRRLLVL